MLVTIVICLTSAVVIAAAVAPVRAAVTVGRARGDWHGGGGGGRHHHLSRGRGGRGGRGGSHGVGAGPGRKAARGAERQVHEDHGRRALGHDGRGGGGRGPATV